MPELAVGFDLDMTLFDTRPGVKEVWEELTRVTGVAVDSELAISRLGPPLSVELAYWVEPDEVERYVGLYRGLYPAHAISRTLVMPGVVESLEVVHAAGGRTLLVTAKHGDHARRHVEHAGLAIDSVVGELWGAGKGAALREYGASIYVGDHVLDIAGARAADALSVAVATGPCTTDELRAAGADVVLGDLTEFPAWFEQYRQDRSPEDGSRR